MLRAFPANVGVPGERVSDAEHAELTCGYTRMQAATFLGVELSLNAMNKMF